MPCFVAAHGCLDARDIFVEELVWNRLVSSRLCQGHTAFVHVHCAAQAVLQFVLVALRRPRHTCVFQELPHIRAHFSWIDYAFRERNGNGALRAPAALFGQSGLRHTLPLLFAISFFSSCPVQNRRRSHLSCCQPEPEVNK